MSTSSGNDDQCQVCNTPGTSEVVEETNWTKKHRDVSPFFKDGNREIDCCHRWISGLNSNFLIFHPGIPWKSRKFPYLNLPQNEGDVTVTSSFYHVAKHSVISWVWELGASNPVRVGTTCTLLQVSFIQWSKQTCRGPFCSIEGGMKKPRPTEKIKVGHAVTQFWDKKKLCLALGTSSHLGRHSIITPSCTNVKTLNCALRFNFRAKYLKVD